jgi:uncharacterized metal-binding protein
MSANNECSGGCKLIFACSGAADVGAIADQAARMLTADGEGQMLCLAGIGGRVTRIMEQTSDAEKILAIDGCSTACTAKGLKEAGFRDFEHLQLADLDFEKGNCPVNEENIASAAAIGSELLAE